MDSQRPYPKTHEHVDAADHLLMQCYKLGKNFEECGNALAACGHNNPGEQALKLRYLSLRTILCKQFTITDEYHIRVGVTEHVCADGTINWNPVSSLVHQHTDIGDWSIDELKAKCRNMYWPNFPRTSSTNTSISSK